jgi:uridine kinase
MRALVLADLAARITRLTLERPIRIAIDGRLASGKTMLADELAACLRAMGRHIIRTSIDGFHRPKAERYARGRYSAEGYYYDSRDLTAVMTLLLAPLGPGGDRRYRTASFDLENDRPLHQEAALADTDAILIVDGTFLQRPELREGWDVAIFVRASEEIATQRGIVRDAELLGGIEATQRLYAERYSPAFALYERLCAPESMADAALHNDDLDSPHLKIRPTGRLARPPEPQADAKTVT